MSIFKGKTRKEANSVLFVGFIVDHRKTCQLCKGQPEPTEWEIEQFTRILKQGSGVGVPVHTEEPK